MRISVQGLITQRETQTSATLVRKSAGPLLASRAAAKLLVKAPGAIDLHGQAAAIGRRPDAS